MDSVPLMATQRQAKSLTKVVYGVLSHLHGLGEKPGWLEFKEERMFSGGTAGIWEGGRSR